MHVHLVAFSSRYSSIGRLVVNYLSRRSFKYLKILVQVYPMLKVGQRPAIRGQGVPAG